MRKQPFTLLLLAFFAGCADNIDTGCQKPTDCKGARICVGGQCLDPGGDGGAINHPDLAGTLVDGASVEDLGIADLGMPDLIMPPDLTPPPPVLSKVSPAIGPTTGGIALTLDGANFVPGAKVMIAGTDAAGAWVSGTQLTATLPAKPGTLGRVAVIVTNPDGQSATRADLFGYYCVFRPD